MKQRKRFGGISFGGVFGGGTTIFSKRYKLNIYKESKTKKWVKIIKKKKFPILIHTFFFVFPLIDILYYVLEFKPNLVSGFFNWLLNKIDSIPIDVTVPSFYIPLWLINVILYFSIFLLLLVLYFVAFKGMRRWHGCEHKVIAAAENDDIDNAIKYTPISTHCGGTYIFIAYFALGLYWFIVFYFFHLNLPVGIMTFVVLMIILESHFFHKYNRLGIWVGKILQRYCTVKEPELWQLKLGIDGMKKLVDVEYNGKTIDRGELRC